MTKKRQKLTPWKRMNNAVERGIKQVKALDEQLAACREELRKMTLRKEGAVNMLDRVRLRNLTLLEDYHDLASDVLGEQRSRNQYSEVGMIKDGIKHET